MSRPSSISSSGIWRSCCECGLDHLGLSTPEAEKPPAPVPEILRVAEHGDGWGVP